MTEKVLGHSGRKCISCISFKKPGMGMDCYSCHNEKSKEYGHILAIFHPACPRFKWAAGMENQIEKK